MVSAWLTSMGLHAAGAQGTLARYIGYYEPYATSHQALDDDSALFVEVENAARSLAELVRQIRAGTFRAPDAGLRAPRQK
jgi:hypothetical protein